MQMYVGGKAVVEQVASEEYWDYPTACEVTARFYLLDDGSIYQWYSNRVDERTTEVPRKYRNHVNLKLLEDISNDC